MQVRNLLPDCYPRRDSDNLNNGKDGDIDMFEGKSRYSHGDPGEDNPLDVFWLELMREGSKVK